LSVQPVFAQTTDASALVKQGVSLHDQGQYKEAIALYEQALKQDPANTTARYELAMTFNAVGRNAEAVALCKQILKLEPQQSAGFYSTYGNALDGLKKGKEAASVYQEGIRQYPDDGPLYFNFISIWALRKPRASINPTRPLPACSRPCAAARSMPTPTPPCRR
jgi:tetratricopeptide (TPR) repeat protein